MRLGGPGAIMTALEWFIFEALILEAGWIGIKELSAMTNLCFMGSVLYSIPIGLNLSVSVLVGNSLGANNAKSAITYTEMALFLAFGASVLKTLVIYLLINYIAMIFTDKAPIRLLMQQTIFAFCANVVPDLMQNVLCGVLKGMGK